MAGIDLTGKDPFSVFMPSTNTALDSNAGSPGNTKESSPLTADWINAGSNILGSLLQSGKSATSTANSRSQADFDSSGWTVNFGNDASVNPTRSQLPQIGGGLNTTAIILAIAALIALKIYSKGHGKK